MLFKVTVIASSSFPQYYHYVLNELGIPLDAKEYSHSFSKEQLSVVFLLHHFVVSGDLITITL